MNGIFVIAELDGPVSDRLHALQERFDPKLSREAPPHITIIGSSGVGPVAPDTPVHELRTTIGRIALATAPLVLRFGAPLRFLQREIVVFPIDPHGPIRELHEKLKVSGLRCGAARYPFTPHCTLNFYPTITPASLRQMLAVRESESFVIHTLRVYHTREPQPPTLLFDAALGG